MFAYLQFVPMLKLLHSFKSQRYEHQVKSLIRGKLEYSTEVCLTIHKDVPGGHSCKTHEKFFQVRGCEKMTRLITDYASVPLITLIH